MTAAASFLNFEELASMDTPTYMARLNAVVPPSLEQKLADLDAEILAFERLFGFDSATMRQKLDSGVQKETLDVCDWLIALDLRARLGSTSTR